MARCEDFPCCGHQLGECPTGPAKTCPECGRSFEPCSLGETYCLACGSRPHLPKFTTGPMLGDGELDGAQKVGVCVECDERRRKYNWDPFNNKHVEIPTLSPDPVPLFWAKYGRRVENICQDCADDYGQAAADDAQDRRYGDHD